MSEHYDLVVIGAGPAGEKGAAQAAYFGKRVCVIEQAPRPGGAAVNSGTIPANTLRETARVFGALRQRRLSGLDVRVRPGVTIADFLQRERAVARTEWAQIADNLKRHEIVAVRGAAHFVDPRTVEVERYGQASRRISGDVVLVATGARPQPPTGFAVDGAVVVDSESLLTLPRIPQRLIVNGGGVVGCEYACTFAALGVHVTIVTARPRLLAHLDADVTEILREELTARFGVAVHMNAEVAAVVTHDGGASVTLSDGRVLEAECVLHSVGRIGNSAGLGLRAIGVRTNARGFIEVNDHYHTGVERIYAVGDVIGFPALASTAVEQARVAVCHAFDLKYKRRMAALIPYGVWTIPEIATVGESEDALRARGIRYEVGRASYRRNPRGQILGDIDGFVKLIFRPDDQRVLGVAIMGEMACELIHIGMACIAFGGTLDFFVQSVFDYPTLADMYKDAAYDGLQALARRYARAPGLPTSGPHGAVTDG